jgi:hypothetical protein
MSDATDAFVELWSWFSTHCAVTSPLYGRICQAVSEDRELLEAIQLAPPEAHLPTSLLAAVHYVLLDGLDHPLAAVYRGESDADPGPLFIDVCRTQRDKIMNLLAFRLIQTNDCGRSALIAPGLTWVASHWDWPLAHVDVGASAGINLLCQEFRIDYGPHGVTGPDDSTVRIECEVISGSPPIADHIPPLVDRTGIDRSPIDLTDPEDALWLRACVWPDSGRLERVTNSIALAQAHPPRVIAGDGNDMLPSVLAELPADCAAVVTTTWAFAYFSIEDRQRFIELLRHESHRRPIAWLSAEGAATVEDFAAEATAGHEHSASDVLGVVLFREGRREPHLLAFVQEHGNWMHWRAS